MNRQISRSPSKGLDNIFGGDVKKILQEIQDDKKVSASEPIKIKLTDIRPNPYQPRTQFDQKALEELSISIKEHGVFNPILVRKSVGGYDLIAGERRWRASQIAGLEEIPCIIMDFDDKQMMEISLLENIQRENLNVIEEGKAYNTLMEKFHYTQDQLAKRLGKSREHISNVTRILRLPETVQQYVISGELTYGHVRALLSLKDSEMITKTAQNVIKNQLNVRKTEFLVKKMLQLRDHPQAEKPKKPYEFYRVQLEDILGLPVSIESSHIKVQFNDKKDLIQILEKLKNDQIENESES